tara:strand:- start:3767 stop:4705 length:939 start_codon:yes stop_codon:yes gene_type:complete
MIDSRKTLILGSNGFLGKNLKNQLLLEFNNNTENLIFHSGKEELDLLDSDLVGKYFEKIKPQVIYNCTAFVGGISYGYEFPGKILHDNSKMALNIFENSRVHNVQQIINPISNCAYPGDLNIYEEKNFWNGKPHESVFDYALTRRLIVALGKSYYSQYKLSSCNLVLSNMYGKYDHFDEKRSHALGAILNKVYKAKVNNEPTVNIWGTGSPIREWLYVQDGVKAMIKSSKLTEGNYFFNVGVNKGISIKDLSMKIAKILDWNGEFVYDTSKPDGALEKRVDGSSSLKLLSWEPEIDLDQGLEETVEWYVRQK